MLLTMLKTSLRRLDFVAFVLCVLLAEFFGIGKRTFRNHALMVLPLVLGVMVIHWTLPPPSYALGFGLFVVCFAMVALACDYFERLCWDQAERISATHSA